ncbi:class F sortase [Streptomyces armeniacus]|uniref:Class F sortase n=1 Tax=Streptomyces armeniacus TaxID=83291 RepID=A0A345XYR6_9ACTN|nr:class F sortase [Streptomyces armeniacus]AXK36782.1 class F sortase [Streptomyces armeniacus]
MTTRHERRATLGRRLEAATAVAAVLLTVVLGQLASDDGSDASTDAAGTSAADARSGAEPPPDAGNGIRTDGDRAAPALPRSAPERLRIARTGTDAAVFTADTAADGGPPVPPKARATQVAWSRSGPAPGERGPALLVGRLDGTARKAAKDEDEKDKKDAKGDKDAKGGGKQTAAALARLEGLRPGARIDVHRADGRTAHFEVDRIERYAQVRYPDKRVYGATDDPQLRLVADASPAKKGEPARLGMVVSAHLVGSDAAG